jgi:two-component system, cell cycle response regulator DivK
VRKVLLVEDNELNRDMLSRRLIRHGWEVATATDGRAGINAAVSSSPDLILMDLSLPEIDGWSATRILKQDPRTRMIPVLALTAHAMVDDRDKCLAAGCDEFETKPVDLERLLAKMHALTKGDTHDA